MLLYTAVLVRLLLCKRTSVEFAAGEPAVMRDIAQRLLMQIICRFHILTPPFRSVFISDVARTGKCLYSIGKLSASQESAFKRQRLSGPNMTRGEFMRSSKPAALP